MARPLPRSLGVKPRACLRASGILAAAIAAAEAVAAEPVRISYLHRLSDFSGPVPCSEVQLWVDRARGEVYVGEGDVVRLFNASGMEIHEFQHDVALGTILSLAVDEDGDVLVLSAAPAGDGPGVRPLLSRYDYRGRLRATFGLSGMPDSFGGFAPNVLVVRDGRLVLASRSQMKAGVFDGDGAFEYGWDLAELAGIPPEEREGLELGGFAVDGAGRLLFTVPAHFRAYAVSPGEPARSFGKPGSGPGSFGVPAGIAATPEGLLLVADRLRNVVLVFDRNLTFLAEFGHRTGKPGSLVRPGGLAAGEGGRVYVSQLGKQGVSVFTVVPD